MAQQQTLRINGACLTLTPAHLRVTKGDDKDIVLRAHPTNPGPVTVSFDAVTADALFSSHPASGVQIPAGGTVTFHLKDTPLGISRRAASLRFTNDNETFARSFSFSTVPDRCSGGSHGDWHVEC